MNSSGPNNPEHHDGSRAGEPSVSAELRSVARFLDERGARERSRLRSDSLERIISASDLQRPLELEKVAPVVGRIAPVPRTGGLAGFFNGLFAAPALVRLAAAVAVLAGVGGAIVLVRSWASPVANDGVIVADGGELGDGTQDSGQPGDSKGTSPVEPKSMIAVGHVNHLDVNHLDVNHLDVALEDTVGAATSSRSASAVIVALADRRAGSLAGFAGADEALAQELEPLFSTGALLDDGDTTYDDLSQELAAVVTRTSALR
jgi:hypothetical protein